MTRTDALTRIEAYFDDGGYLFVQGRNDDVIIRGGENMSPGEIEDVMLEHPAVADVGVVGIPDEQWGEGVAAVVVLRQDTYIFRQQLEVDQVGNNIHTRATCIT